MNPVIPFSVLRLPGILLIACCVLFPASASAEKPAADAFNLREIAPGIYFHAGSMGSFSSESNGDIANLGFISGDRCVAVIDTGGSVQTGINLRQAIKRSTGKPVCYVINTHVHYDHVLGNSAFNTDTVRFIGHQALDSAIAANRTYFLQHFSGNLGPVPSAEKVIGPSVKVARSLTIDLGNRKLNIVAHGTAHTNNDLSVYDARTKTLWAADLLFVSHIPVLNGNLNGWIEISTDFLNQSATMLVPGHGPLPKDWKLAVRDQIRYLKTLRSDIRMLLQSGGTLESAIQTAGNSESGQWRLFDDYHRRNVTRAYTELEWE